MKKRSFRSTFVSVILVITVAISIVNLAVYGINIKKIRQVEVLKMKTAGERIDDKDGSGNGKGISRNSENTFS